MLLGRDQWKLIGLERTLPYTSTFIMTWVTPLRLVSTWENNFTNLIKNGYLKEFQCQMTPRVTDEPLADQPSITKESICLVQSVQWIQSIHGGLVCERVSRANLERYARNLMFHSVNLASIQEDPPIIFTHEDSYSYQLTLVVKLIIVNCRV